MQQATGELEVPAVDPKKKAAQEPGRRGGLVGGAKRASSMTSTERSEIAKKAAVKRWQS